MRRKSAPARPAPVSIRQVEPCRDRNAERAGKEGQELGSLAGLEFARLARADTKHASWRAARHRQADQRRRAHQTDAVAEESGIAAHIRLQHDIALGTEHFGDRAWLKNLHARMRQARARGLPRGLTLD